MRYNQLYPIIDEKNMLENRVTTFIEQYHLLPESGEIIVAVSGGADSLCLLHILHQLCGLGKRYPMLQLHVAHLNHMLRGEASSQDADSVVQLAESWGLPATIGKVDVPALAREERRSLEDAARVARYRFLREIAQGQPIAVAHHADDQVETLLLHWLRGGGLSALVGMQPRQQDIIRPLLAITHAETVAYCQQHALISMEDASNSDPRFLRNRIRHELLPLLTSINPAIRSTLLRNAEIARVDEAWIEAQLDALWPTVVTAEGEQRIAVSTGALLSLPLSLRRHMLRRITARLCGGQSPLELRHHELIERILQRESARAEILRRGVIDHALGRGGRDQSRPYDLPGGLRLIRTGDELLIERSVGAQFMAPLFSASNTEILLPIPGSDVVQGTRWKATAEVVEGELLQAVKRALVRGDWAEVWQLLPSTRYNVYIDSAKVDGEDGYIRVRTRRPGDRIQPLGMMSEKKVQDVLIDRHIARAERASVPLFFSASHCIWLAGICLDERVKLTRATQHVVWLAIEQEHE